MANPKSVFNRREILKLAAATSAVLPLGPLLRFIADGMIQNAIAAAAGASGKRYIYFLQETAPPRWMFDLFLTPYSTNYSANPMVGTVGVNVGGRYTSIDYHTISVKGINAPPIWGVNVPAPGGGTRAMNTLLDNMLVIRGADTGTVSHTAGQRLNFWPVGAEYTLMGLTADAGTGFPLKAINAGPSRFAFSSQNHYNAVQAMTGGAALGPSILNPFTSRAPASFRTNKATIDADLNAAAGALQTFAESQHPGAAMIKTVQDDTDAMKTGRISALLTKWTSLYNKYNALVTQAIAASAVPGVTDMPVGAATRPTATSAYLVNGAVVNTPLDLRTMYTAATSLGFADKFALAELAITENISSAVSGRLLHFAGLSANGGTISERNDQHDSGSLTGLLNNTKMYFVLSACMAELINSLKVANLFNQTVVHLGGEFNRMPRPDLVGSDHAPTAGSATIWSGMVQGPLVIGNIAKDSPIATYPGTWGHGVSTVAGRPLDLGDIHNAIATMLGLPQVLRRTADQQIISLNAAGKVVSNIGTGTQV